MTVFSFANFCKFGLLSLALGAAITWKMWPQLTEPERSVSWFVQHPVEMTQTDSWCQEFAGSAEKHSDCTNAAVGQYRKDANDFIDALAKMK